jgi:16S rRNA (adenine1518-N6/adenine1519-N6)-dimethyltransferase
MEVPAVRLLGAADVRDIAGRLGVRPAKRLGQNFVVEQGTVRQIAALAAPRRGDVILEVGPGLGSLTLALLEAVAALDDAGADDAPCPGSTRGSRGSGADDDSGPGSTRGSRGLNGLATRLIAVEIDPVLAAELPRTLADRAPALADRVDVIAADALAIGGRVATEPGRGGSGDGEPCGGEPRSGEAAGGGRERAAPVALPGEPPTVLAANLPYNVAVPVVLHLLATLPSLARGVVMVQAEVADRMCAGPGSRIYGVPSVKLAWFAAARAAGTVPRSVFWPVPNVDSRLVAFTRRDPPATSASRDEVFEVIDAAFSQRRKTLRAALAGWAGSPAEAERLLRAAGVEPGARGEALTVTEFARIAQVRGSCTSAAAGTKPAGFSQ